MARVDQTMLFLNTVFLMVVSFIPFPAQLVAEHLNGDGQHAAVYAYALTLLAMAALYNVWWRYARHHRRLIGEHVPQTRVDAISRAFVPGVPLYLLLLLVAVVSPLAATVLTFVLSAF